MKLVGQGAGGHARVVLDLIRAAGEHEVIGFLERDGDVWGPKFCGVPILGDDDILTELSKDIDGVFLGVGTVGSTAVRERLVTAASELELAVPSLIHPSAVVAEDVEVGSGAVVMAGAIVQSGAKLGEHSIINTGAIVDHDSVVGAHSHVAPGAVVCGSTTLGERVHIGAGATIIHCLAIPDDCLIGAGATYVGDPLSPGDVVVGVPAKPISRKQPHS